MMFIDNKVKNDRIRLNPTELDNKFTPGHVTGPLQNGSQVRHNHHIPLVLGLL